MNEYLFSVNLGGMIDILSNHLYSTPAVFLRELLQNATDAISLRKKSDSTFSLPEINISIENETSLTFTDNGSGLTEEEIHKFISVIGQSSKRNKDNSFIGRFGIGLLSCFMVTDEIILRTRSVKTPEKILEWHGFSDGKYSIKEIQYSMNIGTEIFIKCKSEPHLFTFENVLYYIRYYGLPIPYPVYISEDKKHKIKANILFDKKSNDEHQNTLEMGKNIFDADYDFLDYIPLESKKGLFSGVAYILPYPVSAVSNNIHRIYLKNMLLTQDGSSILPEWAFFIQCFFNTNLLRPTASREDFYKDSLLDDAKHEIEDCISAYLEKISIQNPSLLEKIVSVHGLALKSIAKENERLFQIFMPYFNFETSFGTLSGKELIDYRQTIFCTQNIDTFRQLRPIFSEKEELLLATGYTYDKQLISMLEKLKNLNVEYVSENLLDTMLEDSDDYEKFENLSIVFAESLEKYDCKASIKKFMPSQLASVYTINSDGEAKRDIEHSLEIADDMFFEMLEAFSDEIDEDASAVLYLNAENPLIQKLADTSDSEKLAVYAEILYVQALIAGGFPIFSNELNIMNDNLIKLIEWGL